MAESILYTETRALADGEMTTHWHEVSQTDNPKYLTKRSRYSYTRYFNAKYKRKGTLGETDVYVLELEGQHRILTALNYVNRQGLHHGLSSSSFGYPFCSVKSVFRKALGQPEVDRLMPKSERYHYLTHNLYVPERYRMDENGLLLREDILDIGTVESYYVSPRNFIFQMNRITNDDIIAEQREERSSSPIVTLDVIEKCDPEFDLRQMLINEQGKVNHSRMTDLELCRLIDDYYVPGYSREGSDATIYTLTRRERVKLYEILSADLKRHRYQNRNDERTLIGKAGLSGKFVTDQQLARCLVMGYEFFS